MASDFTVSIKDTPARYSLDDVNSMINNMSTTFYFMGAGTTFPEEPGIGSVFFRTSDDTPYVYIKTFTSNEYTVGSDIPTGWIALGNTSDLGVDNYEDDNSFSNVKEMKCSSCGAPLKIRDKYNIKCEYCGKVYIGV